MDNDISDYHIAEMAQDLKNWEEVSVSINLSESERKEIKEDYHGRYSLQKRQALRVWRNKYGDKATYIETFHQFSDHKVSLN